MVKKVYRFLTNVPFKLHVFNLEILGRQSCQLQRTLCFLFYQGSLASYCYFIFWCFGILHFEWFAQTLKTKLNIGFLPLDLWRMCLLFLLYVWNSLRVYGSIFFKMKTFPSFTKLIFLMGF